jgi:hypothetical protein
MKILNNVFYISCVLYCEELAYTTYKRLNHLNDVINEQLNGSYQQLTTVKKCKNLNNVFVTTGKYYHCEVSSVDLDLKKNPVFG